MNFTPGKNLDKPPAGFDPKADLATKDLMDKVINKGKFDHLDLTNTTENISLIKEEILKSKRHLPPGFNDYDAVIKRLKDQGIIKEPVIEEKEYVKNVYKKVELNEKQAQILESNLLLEEIERANIFKNDAELNVIYEKVISLEKEKVEEGPEDYYAFAEKGLIKGGRKEVENDLALLSEREQDFKEKEEQKDPKERAKLEKSKKISTIAELGLAYIASKLSLFGKNISIKETTKFDDIKRGVDDVLEIENEESENTFLGLGIDVTFRGLKSEDFTEKTEKILKSIKDGYQTKVKYFKNHNGEMMPEFAVPKIIIYLGVSDVKEIVSIIKNIDNVDVKDDIKSNHMRALVMKQIMHSCKKFGKFAEESNNSISDKYKEVVNSIRELGKKDPEMKELLDNQSEADDVSTHLGNLIQDFKAKNYKQAA